MSTLQENQPFPHLIGRPAARRAENGELLEAPLTSEEFMGHPHIVFFYPKDATSGCTVEVCGFRDQYAAFQQLGIGLIGISRDTVRSHARFIENQNLSYPLIADPERELIEACGLLKPKMMYGKPVVGTQRTTFALDSAGIIRQIWRDVQPIGHAEAVLDWCREAFKAMPG